MFLGDVQGSSLSQALLCSLRPDLILICIPSTQHNTWHSVGAPGVFVDWLNDECLSVLLPCQWWLPFPSPQDSHTPHHTLEPIQYPLGQPWTLGHILIYGVIFPHLCSQYGVSIKITYCTVGTWYTLAVTIIKLSDKLVHTKVSIDDEQVSFLEGF